MKQMLLTAVFWFALLGADCHITLGLVVIQYLGGSSTEAGASPSVPATASSLDTSVLKDVFRLRPCLLG